MFIKPFNLMIVTQKRRDGGIGRRVGLRIQCPKGVQVQILFPAPAIAPNLNPKKTQRLKPKCSQPLVARLKSCPPESRTPPSRHMPFPEVPLFPDSPGLYGWTEFNPR